jgi:hypothetical protein
METNQYLIMCPTQVELLAELLQSQAIAQLVGQCLTNFWVGLIELATELQARAGTPWHTSILKIL